MVAGALARLPGAQKRKHGKHAAMIVIGDRQVELSEDARNVFSTAPGVITIARAIAAFVRPSAMSSRASDRSRGSGLAGLEDRVAAVGGTLAIESPTGEGTRLVVALPVEPT